MIDTAQTLERHDSPAGVLDRMALILDAFNGSSHLSLAEVVRRTGVPRSSAHRMLDRLVTMGWLARSGRHYELGLKLIELGSVALEQNSVHRAATPIMHELHRITGMVVHLGVLDGDDVLYLEKIGGRLAAVVPTRPGARLPARTSAIGKVLLAHHERLDSGERSGILAMQLTRVREQGIAFESGESLRGISCLAAPVGPPGAPVAAISVCGPTAQMKLDSRWAGPVRVAAAAIGQSCTDFSAYAADMQRKRGLLRAMPSAAS